MLPILILLTSLAMSGNSKTLTYGQFLQLLNRKDTTIEKVSMTLSNTVDTVGSYLALTDS